VFDPWSNPKREGTEIMELKNHRVARPDEIRCKDCRCGVQMVRNSILGMPGCCGYGWTCIYYLPERIATEHHMTCDLAERKCRQMNDQDRTMCNLQKLENDLLRKRVLELEEMLKQSMHNNDELRNDNYQLRARVEELERQVQEYKEENVKLLQQCLALYRAVKKANVEMDKIEEKCDNNVWFQKIKERMY
jgi:septal ring factor EnvC (AmiA/AmiB activator)